MLAANDSKTVIGWDALELRAQLPWREVDYLTKDGMVPAIPDSRRTFARKYYRVRGIVQTEDARLAVYTADVSRVGLRLFSPIQLFPAERVQITVPGNDRIELEVTRCRRMGHRCYDCGLVYTAKPLVIRQSH